MLAQRVLTLMSTQLEKSACMEREPIAATCIYGGRKEGV